MASISHRTCRKIYRRVIEIVSERDTIPVRDFEDFVLAVAVKGSPVDGVQVCLSPCKVYRPTSMFHSEGATC